MAAAIKIGCCNYLDFARHIPVGHLLASTHCPSQILLCLEFLYK